MGMKFAPNHDVYICDVCGFTKIIDCKKEKPPEQCKKCEDNKNPDLCTICHKNFVDSASGFDTCEECLNKM